MPVQTQILRNDELQPLRWGWWHIQSLADMMRDEGVIWDGVFPPESTYTFKEDHTVIDPDDGEVFLVKAGDVYTATR